MINSLKQLSENAGLSYVGNDISISSVSINSGDIKNECLFVAIVANRDGHEFIPQAIANGAKAVLVSKYQDNVNIPQIVCENTIRGLRALAKTYRKSLKMPIISLTGSCGKTSVKEMIVTLLGNNKVHSTFANYNNYLGVPMTILETPQDADYAVIEAGTNVGGEIKAAAEIIQPNIAMITNVGASHLENLKTLDGVMTEKGELLKSVDKSGYCIINLDDERISSYANQLHSKIITCSINKTIADIYVKNYQTIDDKYQINISIFNEDYSYKIPAVGKHNIFNSVLAVASLVAAGLKPSEFLLNSENIKSFKGRFSSIDINNNLTVIDDTYNASVSAVKAVIDDLADFDGKTVLVLSSMRELGDMALQCHYEVGECISKANIDNVFLYGDAEHINQILKATTCIDIEYFESKETLESKLLACLKNYSDESTKVIVKGARSYKMEEIVAYIKKELSND